MLWSIILDRSSVKKNVLHLWMPSKKNPKHRKHGSIACSLANIFNVSNVGLQFKIKINPRVHINITVSFTFSWFVSLRASEPSSRPVDALGFCQTIFSRRSPSIVPAFHRFTCSILTESTVIFPHSEQKHLEPWQVLRILLWNLSSTLSDVLLHPFQQHFYLVGQLCIACSAETGSSWIWASGRLSSWLLHAILQELHHCNVHDGQTDRSLLLRRGYDQRSVTSSFLCLEHLFEIRSRRKSSTGTLVRLCSLCGINSNGLSRCYHWTTSDASGLLPISGTPHW